MEDSLNTSYISYFFIFFFTMAFFSKNTRVVKIATFFLNDLYKLCDDYSLFEFIQHKERNLDDSTSNNDDKKEIPPVKYEDQHLDRLRKMSNDYFFHEDELSIEFENEVNKFEKTKNDFFCHYQMEFISLNQRLKEINDPNYLNTYYNKLNNEENVMMEECKERLENEKQEIENTIEEYKQHIVELKNETIDIEETTKIAKQNMIIKKIDGLKNCMIMEKTPLGNVVMFYDSERNTFKYFSDSTIPYRFLEVVARKYAITYQCKSIFVDMEEELKEYEKKMEEEEEQKKKKKDELKVENEKKTNTTNTTITTTKKNVFAKFKSYNKEAGSGRVNKAPPPKNSIPNVKVNDKKDEKLLLKEKSNTYTHEGRFSNFNILKRIDRKEVDKKFALTFAEFKKMQQIKKNEE